MILVDDHARVIEEIQRREDDAASGERPLGFREKFRDNARARRFELFRNGVLTGHVAYSMRAGALRLHRTVVPDSLAGQNIEGILIHNVLLAAHKRRLAAIPYCQQTQEFLQRNPHYRQLIHA